MADYSLALGVRPLQIEDPLTAYSKFAAIQNAQNQNALAQYKLSAAQREDESTNALRQLFSDPKNVDQTSPEFIRSVYGVSPEAGIKYAKSIAEMRKEQGTFDKTESELLTAELARSRGLMGQAQTPEELASIVSNSYNPKTRTGKYFASQGLDVNTALEAIAQTKNDPQAFYTLLESFASNGDKLIENIRAKAQAFQIRPQPTLGRTLAVTPAAQENALGMRLGTPVPTPTQNALVAPAAGGVNTTAIPTAQVRPSPLSTEQPAPAPAGAAAAPKSFATDRLAKIEQEIGQMEDVLAQYPGNKLAADRLKLATEIRDKLVAEVSPKPQVVDLNNQVLTIDMNPKSPTYGKELFSRNKGVAPAGPSSIAVLQAEANALPEGNFRRAQIEQKIKKETENAPSPLSVLQSERSALIAINPKDPLIREYDQRIATLTTHQPASSTITNVNAYAPASVTAQQEFMKETRENYGRLRDAAGVLDNIDKAKKLVSGAKGFMGPGGESLQQAASFLNNRLGTKIDTKGVSDAAELRSRLFFGIMDNLKKLDSQPTAQQQDALQAALGSLGTDPNALPRVLDAFGDTVRNRVERHNQEVTGAETRGVKFPYDPKITLPERAAAVAATAIPAAAIEALKAGKGNAKQFDEIFGAGAAARALGGGK